MNKNSKIFLYLNLGKGSTCLPFEKRTFKKIKIQY